MAYEVGSTYESDLLVTDASGLPTPTATAVLTITLPDGTSITPAVVFVSTGSYHVDYQFVQEGLHKFLWSTTSPSTTKSDYVNVNTFRSIIGVDEAKAFINYEASENREDILRLVMAAATELAENTVGSCVQRTLTNVRIPGSTRMAIRLPGAPLPNALAVTSISSVFTSGPIWTQAAGQLIVSPDSGTVQLANLIPFWLGPWNATYTVGRMVIPPSIQLAVKEIVYDMWSTQRPFGSNEMEPGPEATARFEQMVSTYVIPPHAKSLLQNDSMPGFA